MHALGVSLPVIALVFCLLIAVMANHMMKRRNAAASKRQRNFTASPFDRAIQFYCLGLVAMYTFIINIALSPFRCYEQEDRTMTLVPAPYLNCFDSQWKENWPTVVIGLLYIILIPCFFFRVLVLYRSSRQSNIFHFRFGFLVKGYRAEYYWWGLFQMLRKTLLVLVIDLSSSYNTYLRTFLVLLVFFSTMLTESLLQPRLESSISRLVSML
jgi:hypothetical protein